MDNIKNVYFIGIGGAGMSALARYFKTLGKNVAGYDRSPSLLTGELQDSGIEIDFQGEVANLPTAFLRPIDTLIVITPAIQADHKQWVYFKKNNYTIKKRAEVLGIITKDTFCFAVAGTHGKTTTTSILGHLLFQAGLDVTAFVGGVVENYQTNLIGKGKTITVVEADEFDHSFLQLYPDMACITSTEADHLDIFGTAAKMLEAFEAFASKVEDKSNVFVAPAVSLSGVKVGFDDSSSFYISNLRIEDGWYVFNIHTPNEIFPQVYFGLPGHHNLSNALMAFAMAYTYGVEPTKLIDALKTFQGVRRRFSYVLRKEDLIFIDDYAHHPTEIDAVSQAVHEMYPNKNICAIFQPHLYSRTRDFMSEFARALSSFNQVVLLDIYPARELPIEGITSKALLEMITSPRKNVVSKGDLISFIKALEVDIVLTIGAGDIGEMVKDIKKELV